MSKRKMPNPATIDFVICDNTLNRKGWRLDVEGIDLEGFRRNPVCCVEHDTYSEPVGRWRDLRVERGQLLGTVEFDPNDERAERLYWKYMDGYMSACSLHIIPLEESDDRAQLVAGQRYPTITKSELLEVSLVTVPGQKNAVRLSCPDGGEYQLNLINKETETMTSEKTKEPAEVNPLQVENETLRAEVAQLRRSRVESLIAMHVERGVVSEGEREPLTKLAMADYESCAAMLSARQEAQPKKEEPPVAQEGKALAEQIAHYQEVDQKGDERAGWGYMDYYKRDPEALAVMEREQPERFKKLCADFEAESRKRGLIV